MIFPRLTLAGLAANTSPMVERQPGSIGSGRRAARVALVVMAGLAGSACVSVNAPDKPIVIELNINIKQEVIYRLSQDAKDTIENNSGIF
jgi:hypothetical protein